MFEQIDVPFCDLEDWVANHKKADKARPTSLYQRKFAPVEDFDTKASAEQKYASELVENWMRDTDAGKKQQLLLQVDGSAGTGKTFLIKHLCSLARQYFTASM